LQPKEVTSNGHFVRVITNGHAVIEFKETRKLKIPSSEKIQAKFCCTSILSRQFAVKKLKQFNSFFNMINIFDYRMRWDVY